MSPGRQASPSRSAGPVTAGLASPVAYQLNSLDMEVDP